MSARAKKFLALSLWLALGGLVCGQALPPANVASALMNAYSLTLSAPANALFLQSGAKICLDGAACASSLRWQSGSNALIFTGSIRTDSATSTTGAFNSSVGSGTNAFGVAVNGARVDLGTGAVDYFASDGTSITTPTVVLSSYAGAGFQETSASGIVAADRFKSYNAVGATLSGNVADGASAVGVGIGNSITLSTAGAKIARFCADTPNTCASEVASVTKDGKIAFQSTDSSGTPGAATINKPTGQSAIAAAASSVVITNSLISATSIVQVVLQANDSTCTSVKSAVPAAGSFTVTVNAACTAATKFGWFVVN